MLDGRPGITAAANHTNPYDEYAAATHGAHPVPTSIASEPKPEGNETTPGRSRKEPSAKHAPAMVSDQRSGCLRALDKHSTRHV